MPTKVTTDSSDSKGSLINELDVKKIINDFEETAQLSASNGRRLIKTDGVSIPLEIMTRLMSVANYQAGDNHAHTINIKIKFGITLPDQKDCADETTDISNQLTVVIMIEKDGIDLDFAASNGEQANLVLTPGFKSRFTFDDASNLPICCPGPPNNPAN